MDVLLALALTAFAASSPEKLFKETLQTHHTAKWKPKVERLRDSYRGTSWSAWAEAALLRFENKNVEAEAAYTRALSMKPLVEEAYCGRGNARLSLERHKEMLEDYRKAVELELPCGYTGLGHALYQGLGAPADPAAAVPLLRRAVELNDPLGMYRLGLAYEEGKGLEKNPAEAFRLYERAAAMESEPGQHAVAFYYANGMVVPKDNAKAFEWYTKAAEQECATAANNLGALYANGEGTSQSWPQALRWYQKSADKGDKWGLANLAWLYETGNGVTADRRKAFELYKRSAQQDHEFAKKALTDRFSDLVQKEPLIPKPTAPANISLKVALAEPSGNDMLDGEETASLALTVANAGPGPAYAVKLSAAFEPVPGLAAPQPQTVERIEAGASVERRLELRATDALPARKLAVKVEAKEGNGFDADPVVLEFELRPFRAPRLELSDISIGGSGVVKAGEVTRVTLTVRNAGEGPAAAVKVALDPGTADVFISGDPQVVLGALEPGQSRKASFEFFVNKRFSGSSLPLSVAVSEARGKHGLTRGLGLALGRGAPTPQIVAVKGRETAPAPVVAEPEVENVDAPPAATSATDPEAFAVVIGVEKYRQGLPEVEYATRDAQTIHAYLTKSMGFDPRNVALLQNDLANKTDFEKYLGTWLKNRVTPKSRVLVYYAGHGTPGLKSGESYLVPYDGDPAYAEDTAFPLKRLYENLAALPTKDVTVVLDACFSGAGGRSVIAKGARPLVTKADTAAGAGANTVVLAATAGDQISTHYPEGRHGLLTYFLLKGLRGAADSDKDGAITTAELYGFVKPAVEREARLRNVEQSPSLIGDDARRVWLRTR